MAKQKGKNSKKRGQRKQQGLMGRSDIPYAQRITMQHQSDIVVNRDHAAKIAMLCTSYALHELEGVGYKRLVRFGLRFHEVVDEFYEDPDVGMVHAKSRMEQMGMPISGEFFTINVPGQSKRAQELDNHRLQASQIAFLCGAIAMNDVFGFGQEKQTRISNKVTELTGRYKKEGEKFLLDKMKEIGFDVVNGEARCYMEDDKILTPKQWRKESGHEST